MTEHATPPAARERRERSNGIRSRQTILDEAVRLATVDGIEGLSIGQLADAVGISKSGLYAHFRSKEELQLATIETAERIFNAEVVDPARVAAPGITRLRALCEEFLAHLERNVFPGGCFFASVAAEIDTHPGVVRDRAFAVVSAWFGELVAAATDAQAANEIVTTEDPVQIAFELNAFLLFANAQYVATTDPAMLDRCRRAIERLLDAVMPVAG